MKRARFLTAFMVCVWLLFFGGLWKAVAEPDSPVLLGPGEDAASAIEALGPAAETDLNAALRLGWLLHVYANDNARATPLFERVAEAAPDNVWARFGLASVAKLEGDFAAVAEQMAAVVEHRPEHPLAELALHEWRALWDDVPAARGAKQPLLTALLDNPAVTSAETRGLTLGLLQRDLEWQGRMAERDALLPEMGAVRSWRFAGPFGPLPDLVFYAALDPDDDASLAAAYASEGEVRRTRRHDARGAVMEPQWITRGVYYAETFVRVEKPRRVLVRVSSGNAVRVELNGGTLYFKDTFRTFAPRAEMVETVLPAGWSRLRVKVQSPAGLVVQLLDEQGRPLAVEVDPTPRDIAQAPATLGTPVPTACEAYLDGLVEGDPASPLVLLLTAQLKQYRRNTEAAKIAALGAVEACDHWAAAHLVAGEVLGADRTQPERIARSRAKAHYRRAIELAGTCPVALYHVALYERNERRFKEALKKLEQCVEQAPDNALWWRALYDIYSSRGWAKEREAALEAMQRLNADSPDVVRFAMNDYRDRNLFEELGEAERRFHAGTAHSAILAYALWRAGRLDEAVAEFQRLIEADPPGTSYRRSLVELYEKMGRYDEAARVLEGLLADEPEHTGLMRELAGVELERGNERAAVRLWRRMLEAAPADERVRKALALHGMKEIFDNYSIAVEPYLADESLRERYADYGAVMVVDYAIEQIFADGSGRELTHQLVLVNTKAGIEEWGEVSVAGAEVLELRVIKPDGSIVEPELVAGKGSISLTGLAEGDFVELKYVEAQGPSSWKPGSFLGPRFFFCGTTDPMHLTRYLVIAPVDLELDVEEVNMDVAAKTWTHGEWRFRQWERRKVEPIRPEPNSVGAEEYMPWVRVGFGQHVGFDACDVEDDNIGMATPTLEVRRVVEELVTPAMGHEAIVRTLHTYVNTHIDGGGTGPSLSETASHTLGDKRGDRKALLKAMLEVAGIRSHVVMVRPITAFDSKVFPNDFGYGLLLVEDEQGRPDWWIDVNNKFYPLGFVHPQAQGGRAIVLRDVEGPAPALDFDAAREELHVPVWPETLVAQQVEAKLDVDEDGAVEGTLTTTYTGAAAAGLRAGLERVDEDDIERWLQQTANSHFRGATLGEYEIADRKAFNKPLVVRASFTAPKYARRRGRSLTFNQPLFELDLRKSYLGVPERKTPLAFFSPPCSRYTFEITLPEGTTLRRGIPQLALESSLGSYRSSFEFDEAEHRATLQKEFLAPIQRIQPADYPDFADFCRTIDEHEEQELKVFLPKEPEPPEVPEEPAEEEQPVEEEAPAAAVEN